MGRRKRYSTEFKRQASMRHFAGVDLGSIADEGNIFLFRHRLEREGLKGKLFQKGKLISANTA